MGDSWTALLDCVTSQNSRTALLDSGQLGSVAGWETAGQCCWMGDSLTAVLDGRKLDSVTGRETA